VLSATLRRQFGPVCRPKLQTPSHHFKHLNLGKKHIYRINLSADDRVIDPHLRFDAILVNGDDIEGATKCVIIIIIIDDAVAKYQSSFLFLPLTSSL